MAQLQAVQVQVQVQGEMMGESSFFHDHATAIKLLSIHQPPGRMWMASILYWHSRHVRYPPFETSILSVLRLILNHQSTSRDVETSVEVQPADLRIARRYARRTILSHLARI